MRLYFFRHAIAYDEDDKTPDEQRALTDEGIARTKRAAQVLKAIGVKPDHLLSSPLVRAEQTAEILAQALGVKLEIRSEVAPGFNITSLEALTHDFTKEEILFVGHEPDFSTTITSLTGARVTMKRGGLARIEIISRRPLLGQLVWLIAPKVFEQLS
ncbi:MAG: phosphohistidine phosphatase SixA [Chloroflexota bacterium]